MTESEAVSRAKHRAVSISWRFLFWIWTEHILATLYAQVLMIPSASQNVGDIIETKQ